MGGSGLSFLVLGRLFGTAHAEVANGIDLLWRPWQVHAENWEYELRRGVVPKKSGGVRLLAYTNYANMGIYREAVAQLKEGLVLVPEITNHPLAHHSQIWVRRQPGTESHPERHGICPLGMDNGKTESFAYTEIDSTFNQGVGVNGAQWHRKQDRAGIAFVSNGIKKDHQIYLADGGLRFPTGRWKAELRAGEHRRIVLHGTRLARNLCCSRSAAHEQPRLQPRPGAGAGAEPAGSCGILAASVRQC